MAMRLPQVNFKARDNVALGQFWADALGWVTSQEEGPGVTNVTPANFDWPDPSAVCIDFVIVEDPEPIRYRVHLDLATRSEAHQAELVARLRELGATPADIGQGDVPWVVLADPEGNLFCVLEPRENYPYDQTGPIAAVVVNCADPRAQARFWGEATAWTTHAANDDFASLRSAQGVGPYLEFIRTTGEPGRVHLDLLPYRAEDQPAEIARLEALGARPADVGQGDVAWAVMADPEGNPFCVLRPAS
ncbi:VOC family protein [Paractinoplanes hotanensis]|uniref:VOC family protein n=1 Tax=Paractinoplanes hotanensis TaxID=2906497 RepID=A0ABT0Y4A6_9ACTN|nr:VOC family protein [Actinoplanes hotanensis]MCM4080134.1 VOC family protein [Actinoplanes hotanensis]